MGCSYLITGGAGFIGSHLAEALLNEDHAVIAIDDLSTGSIDNIEALRQNPKFELVIDSVMNVDLMSSLIERSDYIVHLASVVGVQCVVNSPIHTIDTIVKGTDIVLTLAEQKKKTVFIASTSEVYGKSTQLPFTESGDLCLGATSKGRWSYACSKALDEYLALAYSHERQLPVVVARLFNTVGPRQSARYGMVLPRFIKQALSGQPITVYGDGTQRRCFSFVGDVVWAIKRLITNPECYGKVFNIGSNEEISILELANFVKEKTGSSSEVVFIPYEEAFDEQFEDMQRRIPDLRRVEKAIGYRPRTSLSQIIDKMLEEQYVSA